MKKSMEIEKKATLILEKNGTEYWASILELPGCYSVGNSIDNAVNNAHDAVKEYLEDVSEEEIDPLFVNSNLKFIIKYDLQVFFEKFNFLNKTAVAKKAKINSSLLRQYAKGIAFASEKQKEKIENAIHQLAEDLLEATI
ncbi:MAG: type II toxin-antitoxin system HicB family antitoxin [Prolixibacteraceae bacterium]|jgi:predicted RNase H-like HicB family nuclease|nr:type II toxin-antitoxin system HicB family antitoxin [Prolixibacteraceae bacterium]